MTKRRKPVLILCVAAFAVAGATIAVVNAPSSGAATTLGAAAAEQGRVFGTAVAANLLADQRYTDILDTEFTGATPENEMKWDATEPSPGTFRFAAADLRANLERFADLGIEVQITELDVRMPTPPSEANLRTQAEDYAEVVGACLAVSACSSVTVGQISDRDSWIPGVFPGQGAALLFDENFARKPAYGATLAALRG